MYDANRTGVVGLLVLIAGMVTSCAWSVPASPGRNALLRTPPAPAPTVPTSSASAPSSADPATERLYVTRCGRCHVPHPPSSHTAGDWPFYVNRYGPRAGLFGEERRRVLAWLQANAR